MLSLNENAYITVEEADEYWEAKAESAWADATNEDKEAAILEATQYIDHAFPWIGSHPGSSSQILAWPRINAVDSEGRTRVGIPVEVKHGTAELALQALAGPLMPVQQRGGQMQSAKIGLISVSYADDAPAHPSYAFVRHMVRPLIRSRRRLART